MSREPLSPSPPLHDPPSAVLQAIHSACPGPAPAAPRNQLPPPGPACGSTHSSPVHRQRGSLCRWFGAMGGGHSRVPESPRTTSTWGLGSQLCGECEGSGGPAREPPHPSKQEAQGRAQPGLLVTLSSLLRLRHTCLPSPPGVASDDWD